VGPDPGGVGVRLPPWAFPFPPRTSASSCLSRSFEGPDPLPDDVDRLVRGSGRVFEGRDVARKRGMTGRRRALAPFSPGSSLFETRRAAFALRRTEFSFALPSRALVRDPRRAVFGPGFPFGPTRASRRSVRARFRDRISLRADIGSRPSFPSAPRRAPVEASSNGRKEGFRRHVPSSRRRGRDGARSSKRAVRRALFVAGSAF